MSSKRYSSPRIKKGLEMSIKKKSPYNPLDQNFSTKQLSLLQKLKIVNAGEKNNNSQDDDIYRQII